LRSIFLAVLSLASTAAFAADQPLKVEISDPKHAAIAGARVALYPRGSQKPFAIQQTSSIGEASFNAPAGAYRIEVLAPGFAPKDVNAQLPAEAAVRIALSLATVTEEVNVSAAQAPIAAEDSASQVTVLDAQRLTAQNPVSAEDAVRFLPSAIAAATGQNGSLTSLFVRGGDSRYNKVIVDGVPINDAGGTFDFGVLPMAGVDRLEFVRGAQSALYGSDAMTSVVQLFSGTGKMPTPELRFGAEGGSFDSARGYASLAGAYRRADYNFFADQDAFNGSTVNSAYGNAVQGGNVGVALSKNVMLRVRARHSNSRSGVPGAYQYNKVPAFSPDIDQYARANNFLGSVELTVAHSRWLHTLRAYEYNTRRRNADNIADRGCDVVNFNFFDCYFDQRTKFNRAGFTYQGEYTPRSWARTIFGYEFEDEHGAFNTAFADLDFNTFTPTTSFLFAKGLRRNHNVFGEELLSFSRVNLQLGGRYVHNESFGNKFVPQLGATVVLWKGNDKLTGTRLRFAYGDGIKEPRFEESFGLTGSYPTIPNPGLKPEQNRSLEAGFTQDFAHNVTFSATYFNNLFHDQIAFNCDPVTFQCGYLNLGKSLAHGMELEMHVRAGRNIILGASYTGLSTQILAAAPGATGPNAVGQPLLRRPKNSFDFTSEYDGKRWGGTFLVGVVGKRPDSDFFALPVPVTSVNAYTRGDVGLWYRVNSFATAYANVENIFDRYYEEVVGYPGMKTNFRAGMRFVVGGEK